MRGDVREIDRLSARQKRAMVFLCLLSPMVRQLSGTPVRAAGAASWLCPAAALLPALLYTALLGACLRGRRSGEGLADLLARAAGKAVGGAISAVSGLWCVFYGGFLLRSAADRLTSSVYEYGGDTFFIIIMLAAALIAAYGYVRSLGRLAEALVPMMLLVLALILLSAMTEVSPAYLTPVSVLDAGPVALGALPLFDLLTMQADFAFLDGYIVPEERETAGALRWTALLIVCMLLLQTAIVGGLSAGVVQALQHPFFVMVRSVSAFSGVDGFESAAVAVWVVTDLLFLASLLTVASEIFRGLFGGEKRGVFVLPAAAGAAAVAAALSGDAFAVRRLSEAVLPAVNGGLKLVVLPAALGIGKLRKRL